MENGQKVHDAKTWYNKRRPEVLHLFEENVYGRRPGAPKDMHFEVFDLEKNALGGKAIRKQVTVYFSAKKDGPKEDILIYLPANAKKPVPLILSLNFSGNHRIINDPGINVWNTTIAKPFRIREEHSLEFRFETYNTFNHTQFSGIDADFGSSTFLTANTTHDPRIMQFALKFLF